MDKFIIQKSMLRGAVIVSGSKNSALPIMAATLLTDEQCVLHNVPNLMDIRTMIKILEVLGKQITFQKNTMVIKAKKKISNIAPYDLVRTMRASFCVIGPLIAKRKEAQVAFPGGCIIGARPVDIHLRGLNELGANIIIRGGYCISKIKNLHGSLVYLGGPFGSSVLATGNVMMAGALAKGETIIEFAACEPEIEQLGVFLKTMGAQIFGEGTTRIRIKGVYGLGGAEIKIIPDRIEAGTFIAAALATNSRIDIKKANPAHLTAALSAVKEMGGTVIVADDNTMAVKPVKTIKPINITTLPYPGFPTDLQAQFMVCLCKAKGISMITEKIYPDRFMHVPELGRMGARIQRNGPYAIIEGNSKLYGAEVMASDLRASAALIIAGMAAEGETEVRRVYHVDRGYERIEERLNEIGAKIKRVKQ